MIRGQAACAQSNLLTSDARTKSTREARLSRLASLALLPLLSALAACGDDGGGDTPKADQSQTDGGVMGTPMDGGMSGMPMTMIPRRDAQAGETPETQIPLCQRANPNTCPTGEICDVVIEADPVAMGFKAYTGCVKPGRERAAGDPCDPDLRRAERYTAPDLKAVVFRDPCGPGLVCAPNRSVRGAYSCQTECSSGQIDGAAFGCEGANEVCWPAGQITEYCRAADSCSIEKQTGCLGGEGCYMLPGDDLKQFVALCLPEPPMGMTTATGDRCGTNSCSPGSVCLGPVRMPISNWTQTNVTCRQTCNGEMGTAPAADEDAGLPSGLCKATEKCEPYSASGLLLSAITAPPYGQCEAQ
jgi:hypothetical protein